MARASAVLLPAALLLLLGGCRLPDRQVLRPLPEGQLFTYPELVNRARDQAGAAVEAFYVDAWLELEGVARGLEQTARFLPKANDIPAGFRGKLESETTALGQDAVKLADAAKAQDVTACNEALQRINLKIRLLRPAEAPPPPPLPPAATEPKDPQP